MTDPRPSLDWNHVRVLLAVAQSGSFTGAAAALGVAQPTVGRQVAALEAALQVTLVERVGRGVTLTEAAHALLEHAREMDEGARRLERVASGRAVEPAGVVTLSASEVFAAHLLPPILRALRAEHPRILLDVVATSAVSDLRRREADIALRHVQPTDPELVATRLPARSAWWYGTTAYLETVGRPAAGDDVRHLTFLAWDRSPALRDHLAQLGVHVTDAQFPVVCGNQLVQWAMAREGMGLAVMESSVGDATPGMERALPGCAPIPVPMWLATHREVRTSARVRAVFRHLADAFRAA